LHTRSPIPLNRMRNMCCCSLAILFLSACTLSPSAYCADNALLKIFQAFWDEAKANIYPVEREKTFFNDANYQLLLDKAQKVQTLPELTSSINAHLERMEVSHTQFYDNESIEFYLFRSMFSTRSLVEPVVNHIGIQTVLRSQHHVIREVLDGYPAQHAGIRRGDILLSAGGKPFHPYHSLNPKGGHITLEIIRNGQYISCPVDTIKECPNQSFYNAMLQSKKTLTISNHRIGYVHLWAGTHQQNLTDFANIVLREFSGCDGILLDLRGGFGGAWYDYLDPFFKDRSDYFLFTSIDRQGNRQEHKPDPKTSDSYFAGPLVVLINEGVRSGKESLAYQFRKSGRAPLVGSTTAGAFTVGKAIFTDLRLNYFLFLASAELLLDGQKVEGIGIKPHVEIPYPLDRSLENDPQMEQGLKELIRQIAKSPIH
jgi:carboxyl-terminal processing protease